MPKTAFPVVAALLSVLALALTGRAHDDAFDLRQEQPFVSIAEDAEAAPERPITFAFWNIEYWPGGMFERPPATKATSVANQMVAVKRILDRESPAILFTSEIHGLAAARFLNRNLENPYPFVAATAYTLENTPEVVAPYDDVEQQHRQPPRIDVGRRHEHAVFSRIPWDEIWEVEVEPRSVSHDYRPRGFVVARFTVDDEPLWIYGVHPNVGGRWASYRAALPGLILRDMEKRGLNAREDRVIASGDFNMDLYASASARADFEPLFEAGFVNTFNGVAPEDRDTKPTKGRGITTIDYIFVSRPLAGAQAVVVPDSAGTRPVERAGRDPGIPSDHRMVRYTLPE